MVLRLHIQKLETSVAIQTAHKFESKLNLLITDILLSTKKDFSIFLHEL